MKTFEELMAATHRFAVPHIAPAELTRAAEQILVDDATQLRRVDVCMECDQSADTPDGRTVCRAPGCKECAGPGSDVRRLARYAERLPHYGCKHPRRADGKGWPA